MRKLLAVAIALVCVAMMLVGGIFALSEFGGEVVTVQSIRDDGSTKNTRLWIVDDAGETWLRAGIPNEAWLSHIAQRPTVQIIRDGRSKTYTARAVRTDEARDRVHALMAEKYRTADKIISVIRDPTGSIAVKVEPATQDQPVD